MPPMKFCHSYTLSGLAVAHVTALGTATTLNHAQITKEEGTGEGEREKHCPGESHFLN